MTVDEYLTKFCGPHCYGEQDANGVDLSLIRRNLSLPPIDRLRRGDQATSDALWIRANARRTDPAPCPAAADSA